MTDQHNQSFFGQNYAMFVRSSSKYDDYIFIQSIKRKSGNTWEKPSQGEGKNIKISLGEMIMILKVLDGAKDSWSTYHRYREESTQISFNWQEEVLWINIGEYAKKLQSPNIEILKLLLHHLVKEKIEFATGGQRQNNRNYQSNLQSEEEIPSHESSDSPSTRGNLSHSPSKSNVIVKEEIIRSPSPDTSHSTPSGENNNQDPNDTMIMKGSIQRETPKALLIRFEDGNEVWIPKSTIYSKFSVNSKDIQPFLIQSWVLEKNNAIT